MKKNKKTLLWRIEHDNLKAPCYVFGTMHVSDERAFGRLDALQQHIQQCDTFAAEFDLTQANSEQLAAALVLPDGKTLDSFMSPKIYAKLAKVFEKEIGVPLEKFKYHKPLAISNMLTEAQFANDRAASLDETLYQFAQLQHKQIVGLESFEGQIHILQRLPYKTQVSALKTVATNFPRVRRQVKKTTQAYLQADLDKILAIVKRTSGDMRQLVLYQRNETMAQRIWEIATTQSLFAAIGAGHLAGGKGVLRLLKKRGCQLTPIHY